MSLNLPLVSIILPTYNVAEFLKQCLDSIDAQTYQNYEVIIIIDGATDGSYEIAKKYCETHEKFSLYWQENAGSGPARNAGLLKAQGEFIMFVDPDDWIDRDLLENLVSAQQQGNFDLVATRRITTLFDNAGVVLKTTERHYKDESISDLKVLRSNFFRMLKLGAVSAPTQKLYRKSIILQHKIEFPDLRRSQDIVFNYRYYSYIESLKLLSYSGYHYRVLLKNSSGRTGQDYYKTILYVYNGYKDMYKSWNMEFPDKEFCTYFFEIRVFANLQRCAVEKWDMQPILEEPTIHHIVINSGKVPWFKKFARFLILKKLYRSLKIYMMMVAFLKQKGIAR